MWSLILIPTTGHLIHWTRGRRVETDAEGLVNLPVQAATQGERYYRSADEAGLVSVRAV